MDLFYMDVATYRAAANGEIDIFMKSVANLAVALTPSKNTVLHIHITAQTGGSGKLKDSTDFVEKILDLCPPLLLQPNIKGETSLHIAARHGLDAVVETLLRFAKSQDYNSWQELESGIDASSQMVRMMNNYKETALHEAVRYRHLGVVQQLTRADPDFPYFANEDGETPLYLAIERGYHDLVFEILATCTLPAHGGPNGRKSLHAAVICNDEDIITKLMETQGSLTAVADDQGWTPLHYAAHFGYAPVVKLLLQYDTAAAYIGDRDGKKIALHIAANGGHIDVMYEILSRCPDCCELVDNKGWNVFHFALESNSDLAVKFIIENSSFSSIINEKEASGSANTSLRWLALEAGCGKNLSAPDIILSNADFSGIKEQNMGEDPTGLGERVTLKRKQTGDDRRLKDIIGNQLIVATLIATVTFTAGFTMPGGLNSEAGPTQGAAILTGSKAFRAFVIANTIAMGMSSSAVASHIFMERNNRDNKPDSSLVGFLLTVTLEAQTCMVIAFITGIYAVLEHSSAFGIGLAICIVSSCIGLAIWMVADTENFDSPTFRRNIDCSKKNEKIDGNL